LIWSQSGGNVPTALSADTATQFVPYPDSAAIFAGTADYYLRYRPGHPTPVLDYLAGLARARGARVLDLGCGPGTVALALAERGIGVVAVDPNADMLAAGRRAAAERRIGGVEWRRGDAHRLDELADLGEVAGATIGDAFHWLDRERTLAGLDDLVTPAGFVAVVCSRAPGTPKPWWEPVLDRIRDRHLGPVRHAGPDAYWQELTVDHETVLRRSAFPRVTALRVDYDLDYGLDELLGLQLSQAYSSPAVLGDRQEAFQREVRAALAATEPSGRFRASMQAHLIIGRRHDR
jgi:SAM-dependent methyltransferase